MTKPKTPEPQPTTAVEKKEVMVEFIPHGSNDKLKLTIAMVKAMVAVPTKAGHRPSDQDCIKFIALCQARKLNPFELDAYLIGYDSNDGPKFSLITAHQAFLKRAELHPEFNGMKSGVIVERGDKLLDLEGDFHLENDKVVGGWACVYFKGRQVPMMKRVRLKRFNKGFGVWRDDPGGMICKCAEADALRSSFPTMCGGMYLKEEYKDDVQPTGMSQPIFTQPAIAAPGEPVNVTPEPAEPEAISPKERVKILCEESGVTEEELVLHCVNIDLADNETTIEELSDDTIHALLEDWDSHEAKIKEARNAN